MTTTSRRTFLAGGAAAAVITALPGSASAATEPARTTAPIDVLAGDLRYGDLVVGNNARWVGTPQVVRIAHHAADVERVVGEAVAADKKIGVRSDGHCYEDFATGGAQVLLDLSRLDDVRHDPALGAFVIEPGVRLISAYERLFTGWGVTIPGGTCHSVGAGGHIVGGGYGLLSRVFGLTVDHLHGVEVVVVDGAGRARTVLATREQDTDLWWAHTGGGRQLRRGHQIPDALPRHPQRGPR